MKDGAADRDGGDIRHAVGPDGLYNKKESGQINGGIETDPTGDKAVDRDAPKSAKPHFHGGTSFQNSAYRFCFCFIVPYIFTKRKFLPRQL